MVAHDYQVRLEDAAVQLHNYRLDHVKRDQAYEINVDFFAQEATSSLLLWTSIDTRMRVSVGGGGYQDVGSTRATAVDLGAFSAGETKSGVIEIKVPAGATTRHEELVLNVGYGI